MCIDHLPLTSYLWSFFILISAYALLLHVLLTFKQKLKYSQQVSCLKTLLKLMVTLYNKVH